MFSIVWIVLNDKSKLLFYKGKFGVWVTLRGESRSWFGLRGACYRKDQVLRVSEDLLKDLYLLSSFGGERVSFIIYL